MIDNSHSSDTSPLGAGLFIGDEASTGNSTRAQDYNSSRKLDSDSDGDSILEEPRDSPDNDCNGIVEVSPMPGGKVKIKVTCND